jgi:ankyrin repeat protein
MSSNQSRALTLTLNESISDLYDRYSGSSRTDAFESIKALCSKSETRPEPELLELLKTIIQSIQSNSSAVRERDARGCKLLHYAAQYRSVDFIKLIVEAVGSLECAKAIDISGRLPIHVACYYGNVEVAKYLILLYPESINVTTRSGSSLLHLVLWTRDCTEKDREELTRFLILHDQGALAMPNRDGDLLLHSACRVRNRNFSVVKLLYDANPNAMKIRNNFGFTPLDIALEDIKTAFVVFFVFQLKLQHQARDIVQPDANGQLPIHQVLRTPEPSLGTIKLMVAANLDSLTTADNQGFRPIHIACKFGHLRIVKYLIEVKEDSLRATTVRGYLPLHIACLSGKCHVVNYILERSDYGASLPIHNKLPIELLLSDLASCERNSLEYVEAVGCLLRLNPAVVDWEMLCSKLR